MIAARRRALLAPATDLAGQLVGFVQVVEAELDDDPVAAGADGDLVAERRLERVGGVVEGGTLVGIGRRFPRPGSWLAGQPNTILGLADRPPPRGGLAGQAPADVVAGDAEEGLAVALAELPGLGEPQG